MGIEQVNPGDLISGKYRLLRLLGSGGMGSVWAARNELTDRDFAIKFLLSRLASNQEALQRFFHEARACGQIKHPAIVDVYDMGQAEDGTPYIVMEILEGEGMDQRLARERQFNPNEAASWIAFIARGLDEAHTRGLIHRDLKPGNIFFALDDRGDVMPKVLDFGISKMTGPKQAELAQTMQGTVLGSPAYMSPEQARGDLEIDGRSDVWALGVILYESITGNCPFHAANYNALMVEIITKPHRPVTELAPTCARELAAVVDKALEKDRNKRVGSARELADRLEHVLMQITNTPYMQYQPRTSMLSVRPPAFPPPITTTQGPWSDAAPTMLRPRRAKSPYIAVGMGALALVLAGAVVAIRSAPPLVAVADRAGNALTTALARAHERVELARTEALAEEKLKEAQAAKAALVTAPTTAPADRPKKIKNGAAKKDDPHGGVEGPGF